MIQSSKREFPDSKSIRRALDKSKGSKDRDYARVFAELVKTDPHHDWPLLEQVFNFHFKPGDLTQPFGPMWQMEGKRSMMPEDLSDENLDALQSTLESIDDPEYCARIGDLLWLRRKNIKAARIAVEYYLKSGIQLEDPKHWVPSMERYQRAIRLARQVEPKGDLPKLVLAHLEARVKFYDGTDPLFFTLKALELLVEFQFGSFSALAELAGNIADKSQSVGDYNRARSHFEVQSKLFKLAKKGDAAEIALVKSAETFVEEAMAREVKKEFIAAHSFWGNAIRAFRDRPSLRSRLPELQKNYTAAGEKTRDEMSSISSDEIDISKFVEASRAAVKGLAWADAFFTFVTLTPIIDPKDLRTSAIEKIKSSPLLAAITADILDAAGRKVGIRPSAFTDDPVQYENAVVGFMEQDAGFHRHLMVHAHIAPAIRQILEEHTIDNAMISSVLGDSKFVPDDRRKWFNEAFLAGFKWDFSTSLHVLIPQIENALRHALSQSGESPINIDNNGIEEVWGLEKILNYSKTTAIFGESFVYELKSLLVERLGSNLRNLFAHGLLSPNDLEGETALYLWWVFLRLAAYPTSGMKAFIERERQKKSQPE